MGSPYREELYTLTFPGGDVVTVQALTTYTVAPTTLSYRTITGTSLDLSDNSSAASPHRFRFSSAVELQHPVSSVATGT